jgi:glycosyltransferase involved in cell wall biosynthesis
MRVCFLGARYSQPLDKTSAKKFRALKSLGELFVIGFSQDLHPRRFTEHAHFYLLPKLPVSALRYLEMFMIGPLLILWLVVRRGIQVLVTQSPYEGFAAALARMIAGWLGYRVVLVVESHGDFEESLFLQRRILLPALYRFLMHFTARFALQRANLLRSVSNSTRKQLERWVSGKLIFQFATWTDMESFLLAGAKEDRQLLEYALYAGMLIPRKGVHDLISAFGRVALDFPQVHLVIVGPEENKGYTADLKEQVRRLGIDGKVHFMGEVTQIELAEQMRGARMFVLPTYSEGLPRVIFEAMAVGLPIVASAVSGIPEVLQNGRTGLLVQPRDEVALAEKIRWVLEHPDEAREMGRCARAFAEQFFSTEAYVQGYRRILEAAQPFLMDRGAHAHSTL